MFIKRSKLKLLIQNLRLSYNEKFKNDFDKFINILKDADNSENDILDIDGNFFRILKKTIL